MESTDTAQPRRRVISIAVDCTGSRSACTQELPVQTPGASDRVTYYRVVRKQLSQLTVLSQEDEVVMLLDLGKSLNPFGLQWQVSSPGAAHATQMMVKKAFMSGLMTFEGNNTESLAFLTHTLCSTSSKLHWQGATYRWRATSVARPLTLELRDAWTGQCIARLKGASANPWSKDQYIIALGSGQSSPTWLQVVIASGIGEAMRMNGRYSSNGAAVTQAAM